MRKFDGSDDAGSGRTASRNSPEVLPPLLIQVGSDEILLDDARRYAQAAADKGGEVQLEIYEGLHHVFQNEVKDLPTARRALDAVAAFLSRHWA